VGRLSGMAKRHELKLFIEIFASMLSDLNGLSQQVESGNGVSFDCAQLSPDKSDKNGQSSPRTSTLR